MGTTPGQGTAVSADGTAIVYDVEGDGPPIVLVDPAGGYRDFGPVPSLAAAVVAAGGTAITYDRRGRGLSGNTEPYAVGREVEDLAAVLVAVGRSPGVFGYSSGALLCLQAGAASVPVQRLALLEPPLNTDGQGGPSAFTTDLLALVDSGDHAAAARHFMASIVPQEILDQMDGTGSWAALEAIAPSLVHDSVLCDETTLEVVRAVDVPTLVLLSTGTTGELPEDARRVVEALPDGRISAHDGGWHGIPDEVLGPLLVEHFGAPPA